MLDKKSKASSLSSCRGCKSTLIGLPGLLLSRYIYMYIFVNLCSSFKRTRKRSNVNEFRLGSSGVPCHSVYCTMLISYCLFSLLLFPRAASSFWCSIDDSFTSGFLRQQPAYITPLLLLSDYRLLRAARHLYSRRDNQLTTGYEFFEKQGKDTWHLT